VLDPFDVLIIEGYRQSLDNVAAFRFSDLESSYSARLGTPANVGVIGVAAFAEKVSKRRHKLPLAPIDGDPFPGEDAAPRPAPAVVSGSERARAKSERREGSAADMSWAAPEQPGSLGTEYGESTFAPVEEVPFKRAHSKQPDQLLVVRYDSMQGLRARGVLFDETPPRRPIRTWEREPVRPSNREFAPPPPPRDWWR
jgi:hypothetical protein